MTVIDLLAGLEIAVLVAIIAIAVRVIWRIVIDDLKGKNEHEEDEHASGLSAPWNRRKR